MSKHMLAVVWDDKAHPRLLQQHPYLMSTKWDGIRAVYDPVHKQFVTRNGHVIKSPAWFTHNFPQRKLDGELYISSHERLAIKTRDLANSPVWHRISYKVFDDLSSQLPFADVYKSLQQELSHCHNQFRRDVSTAYCRLLTQGSKSARQHCTICLIKQTRVTSLSQVKQALSQQLSQQGEGVVLRRADQARRVGRSAHMIKLKGRQDDEAVVVGYEMGRGAFKDTLGALVCEWRHQRAVRFKVGTGFSEHQRRAHLTMFPLHTIITVQYESLEPKTRRPRFPRLAGIRQDV